MMKEERGDTVLGNDTILDSDDLLIRQNGGLTERTTSDPGICQGRCPSKRPGGLL